MTEKQFFASKWKPFEILNVYVKEFERNCECYLVAIDFEEKLMKIRPLDANIWENGIYVVPINIIDRKPKNGLRIVHKYQE